MKGFVFVLLGCFALFFAAPTLSFSISEGDQLANRQDTQSGSPSTDATTSGDAGESKTIKMVGDANPGDESIAGDTQAEKSKIRKRDTRPLVTDEMDTDVTTIRPIDKEFALALFRQLGKYGGKCFEQAFDYIEAHEMPTGIYESTYSEAAFTRSHMTKWLEIMKDSVSECLMTSADHLSSELLGRGYDTADSVIPPPHTFANVPEFLSPLMGMGKMLKKCLEDAIRFLEVKPHDPGDTVQRSSESFSGLLADIIELLLLIEAGAVPAGDTVPTFTPGDDVAPYLDSAPVITTYKKRNSLDKPRGYHEFSNLPGPIHSQYADNQDIRDSNAPQFSGFGEEAAQIPYTPGRTTCAEDVNALPIQKLSLLSIVLDKIYSKLQGKVSPAVNTEVAPVEELRVDEDGALGLYPGDGESPAMGNVRFNPECSGGCSGGRLTGDSQTLLEPCNKLKSQQALK